jgi:hypothetical protein
MRRKLFKPMGFVCSSSDRDSRRFVSDCPFGNPLNRQCEFFEWAGAHRQAGSDAGPAAPAG